jgi:hypothetical protein
LDWDISNNDSLLVSGGVYQSTLGIVVPAATIASPNAPPANDVIHTNGGNVHARWQHIVSESSTIEVNFSFEHMPRKIAISHQRVRSAFWLTAGPPVPFAAAVVVVLGLKR